MSHIREGSCPRSTPGWEQAQLLVNKSTCERVPTSEGNELPATGCQIIKHYRGNEFHDLFPHIMTQIK